MYQDFREKFWELTDSAESIVITTHIDSDNDAIASLLSIYHILEKKYPGKAIAMIVATKPDPKLSYFANFHKIKIISDFSAELKKYSLGIFLDANYDERFNLTYNDLKTYTGQTICIDHHSSKAFDNFTLTLIEPTSASATELVYFSLIEEQKIIETRLCEILMLGLLSDTYRFQYITPNQTRVFDMAKRLVKDGGISIEKLQGVYEGISEKAFAALAQFMRNAKIHELPRWSKFLTSYLTREEKDKNELSDEESHEGKEKFVGYLKEVTGVNWGFVLYPLSDGGVKVSFRSGVGGPNVKDIAEGLGVGSGHDRSAGGTFLTDTGSLLESEECHEKIIKWLEDNKIA